MTARNYHTKPAEFFFLCRFQVWHQVNPPGPNVLNYCWTLHSKLYITLIYTRTGEVEPDIKYFTFFVEYSRVYLHSLHCNCETVLEIDEVFTFVKQKSIRTKDSNEEPSLGLVHVDCAAVLSAFQEVAKLLTISADKQINNSYQYSYSLHSPSKSSEELRVSESHDQHSSGMRLRAIYLAQRRPTYPSPIFQYVAGNDEFMRD